jgi:hypothetical protein
MDVALIGLIILMVIAGELGRHSVTKVMGSG